jgi:hypothetical protein
MGKGKSSGKGSARPGRKRLYSLVIGILLVVIVVAFALYYVASKTSIVKIAEFAKTGDALVVDQVLYRFSATIENQGINDVSGLVLKVRVLGDGVELGGDSFALPTLLRGQKYAPDELGVWTNLTAVSGKAISFSAKLELDNRTLDEATSS